MLFNPEKTWQVLRDNPQVADLEKRSQAAFKGPIHVNVSNREAPLVPARDFWQSAGVLSDEINVLLDEEGNWQLRESFHQLQLLFLDTPRKFLVFVNAIAKKAYVPVQRSLNAQARNPRGGFNGHEYLIHVRGEVAKGAFHLLSEWLKQATPEEIDGELVSLSDEIRGEISDRDALLKMLFFLVAFHDAGNAYGRGAHAFNSVEVVKAIFGDELLQASWAPAVMLGIITHDEPESAALISYAEKEAERLAAESDRTEVDVFFEIYSQLTSVLASLARISDKSDISYKRVGNGIIKSKDDYTNDLHFVINALLNREFIGLIDQDAFEFRLVFTQDLPPKLEKEHQNIVMSESGNRQKWQATPQMRATFHADDSQNYFKQTHDTVMTLYGDRMKSLVLDAFRVYRQIQHVKIRFVEYKSDTKQPLQEKEFVFTRQNVLKELDELPQFISHFEAQAAD